MYDNLNMINCGNTNCYVIRGNNGDILIDTGEKKYQNEIEMWLLNYDIKLIVLTHGHNDHIENAAYFSKLYNARILMSEDDYSLAKDNMSRSFYTSGLSGQIAGFLSVKNMKQHAEEFDAEFISDGQTIGRELGISLFVIKLDGHTKGSLGFYIDGDLYIGDAVMNLLYPSFPYLCESPKASRKSIEKLKTLKPTRIMFGHGMPIETKHNKAYLNLFSKNIIM